MKGNPFINVRLAPQSKAVWRLAAERAGKSLSEYIRAAVSARVRAAYPELYECATCGVLVADSTEHVHATSWQGS